MQRMNFIKKDHIKVVDILLENGADIDTMDIYGETPLHFAARNNHANTIVQLRKRGAKINIRTDIGDTPLHLAAHAGGYFE